MQAAHDACCVPLIVSNVLHRGVGVGDARVEKQIQVDTAAGDDPEEIPAERAKAAKRIVLLPEAPCKYGFSAGEQDSQDALQERHCLPIIVRASIRAR